MFGRKKKTRHAEPAAPHDGILAWAEEPGVFHGSVDRAYPLGALGLLVFGWFVCRGGTPRSISVCSPDGQSVEVGDRLVRMYRADVLGCAEAAAVREDMLGFLLLAPLPSERDDIRLIRFDLGPGGVRTLRIPTDRTAIRGPALAREILSGIVGWERLRTDLHGIYDRGLGQLLEALSAEGAGPPAEVQERQYGAPPADPFASVIVPLYGRFDFMRHQLAHFADDPDFAHIDLVYVVDDPRIISAVADYAAHCHPMFGRPFRVISYGQNRGFAGANNIGVARARAPAVVLLNSDVIPQQTGWVRRLVGQLGALPSAGAVAPLLQFGDGGVQHAGMRARRDPALPGFVMNVHPGKGQPWHGSAEPSLHPLLTGACLCLRAADYAACGGLDEGYLVGDFEDSDLCLKLRGRGLGLWLDPSIRLWHLERQSQALDGMDATRALITLFNAWRYERRVREGVLPDPELWSN